MLDKYTKKEKLILNQYKNGPYHTMITNLTEKEHLQFVNKLIDDNDLYCVIFLTSIYTNYNQKFLIDYFIKCDDIDMLVNFLNTCNDFWNALDQKYIVDSILKLKNKISQEIYEVYPIYKQLDIIGRIGGYTDNDFNEMKAFIEEKIKKYQNSKTIINN